MIDPDRIEIEIEDGASFNAGKLVMVAFGFLLVYAIFCTFGCHLIGELACDNKEAAETNRLP